MPSSMSILNRRVSVISTTEAELRIVKGLLELTRQCRGFHQGSRSAAGPLINLVDDHSTVLERKLTQGHQREEGTKPVHRQEDEI